MLLVDGGGLVGLGRVAVVVFVVASSSSDGMCGFWFCNRYLGLQVGVVIIPTPLVGVVLWVCCGHGCGSGNGRWW